MFLYIPCVNLFLMRRVLIEIKARCADPARIREILLAKSARPVGTDHQIDTYFRVPHGRLKLRQGDIENTLIFYARPDQHGPKRSDVALYPTTPASPLKQLLSAALGVLVTVDKRREIYFLDNVKFHIDQVKGLGGFVEIEAIGEEGADTAVLLQQCRYYMQLFGVKENELESSSYSDLLLQGASQS